MSLLLICSGGVTLILAVLKIYNRRNVGKVTSQRKLTGKTAIVTGANTGIGFMTAMDFANRGAKVILACRNEETGKAARDKIISQSGNPEVEMKKLDLASFHSIREFAAEVKRDCDTLDILVNNAGGYRFPNILTEDGIPICLQVNFVGGYLLSNLLLDLLKKSSPSRIVNVASSGYKLGHINLNHFTNSNPEDYPEKKIYCHSKLAVMLATMEMGKRLKGSGVTVNSAEPGCVKTDLFRNCSFVGKAIIYLVGSLFSVIKTCEQGAQTSIHCAVSEEVEGVTGKYFSECTEITPSAKARDEEMAVKLVNLVDDIIKKKKKN